MEWTTDELKLFCDIQGVAARTGLPIVISALKHLYKYLGRKTAISTLIADIKGDEDFERAGYVICSDKTIEEAIRNLVDSDFLRKGKDEIMLDEKGLKAIDIMRLKKQ